MRFVDFGGGFGVGYGDGPEPQRPARFVEAALGLMRERELSDLQLLIEPGRALVARHGTLVAGVLQAKRAQSRRWLMLDAGMNDLIRPALYQAHHRVEPLDAPPGELSWQVVGPVCESADDFGFHPIGDAVPRLVAIRDAGAYGFVMASEYNGRPLPHEVFVKQGRVAHVSRSRGVDDWIERRLGA